MIKGRYITKEQRIKLLEKEIERMKELKFGKDLIGIFTNQLKSLKQELNNDNKKKVSN